MMNLTVPVMEHVLHAVIPTNHAAQQSHKKANGFVEKHAAVCFLLASAWLNFLHLL
jgi:hypothetical protein